MKKKTQKETWKYGVSVKGGKFAAILSYPWDEVVKIGPARNSYWEARNDVYAAGGTIPDYKTALSEMKKNLGMV